MHAISNPLSPGNGDLRVILSGHFCASLHVGHTRSIRPVFDYRITGVEAQIKTNKLKTILCLLCKILLWQILPQLLMPLAKIADFPDFQQTPTRAALSLTPNPNRRWFWDHHRWGFYTSKHTGISWYHGWPVIQIVTSQYSLNPNGSTVHLSSLFQLICCHQIQIGWKVAFSQNHWEIWFTWTTNCLKILNLYLR